MRLAESARMISLIVAASRNNVIGKDDNLPWHLPDDLKRFKALTMGKPIVMGRRTFESIGQPLPGRQNIVVTRQPEYVFVGATVVPSPDAAVAACAGAAEIMIIGGAEIYAAFLPQAERVYLTRVDADFEGDCRFPLLDEKEWAVTSREAHSADAAHRHDFVFMTLEKRRRHSNC